MIADIIRGNAGDANASSFKKGWVVGHMHLKEGGDLLAGSTQFEIKLWHYDGPTNYGKKSFTGTEFIVIYGGVLRFEMENEAGEVDTLTIDGRKTEYVILPPGITKEVVVVEAPAFGVTVRWPSGPGVNKVINDK